MVFFTSRLCLLCVVVVVLCARLNMVSCDDAGGRQNDNDEDDDNPNANTESDGSTPKSDDNDHTNPNIHDDPKTTPTDLLSALGLNDSNVTILDRPANHTGNATGKAPRLPHESPIAGDNTTAPPPLTSTTTTTTGQNDSLDEVLGSAFEPDSAENATISTTPFSTTSTNASRVNSDVGGPHLGINASEVTSPSPHITEMTTQANNVTSSSDEGMDDLINGMFDGNSTLLNDTATDTSTSVGNSPASFIGNGNNATDNSTVFEDSTLSSGITTEYPDFSSTTLADNSTFSNDTKVDNSTTPSADSNTSPLTTQNPEDNATLATIGVSVTENATLQYGTTEDNSTSSDATDVDFTTTLPSATTNDSNTTLTHETNVNFTTTLPSGLPEGNATTDNSTLPSTSDLTTATNVDTTTPPTSETTLISPAVPTDETPVPKEILPKDCSDSLGLENGAGRLTASDWSPGFLPEEARLNGRSGWVGGFVDVHYIQVELAEVQGISGLLLQPHAQWHRNVIQEFRFLYSLDGYHWSTYSYTRNNKTYEIIKTALDEHVSESLHVFNPPVQARFVAINPVLWVGKPGPALRLELYGCVSTVLASSIVSPRVYRGDMMKETTWDAGAPYLVDQMIRIWPGVTFRLLPGVQVYFTNAQAGFFVEGRIVAEGTEKSAVSFESGHVLSHLTVGPFWRGLDFVNGVTDPSVLRYVQISGAGIGVQAIANSVTLKDVNFQRCETGFRLESGTQNKPNVIENGLFTHNKYGIHIQNVTGNIQIAGVHLRDQQVIGINGFFVYEPNAAANGTTLTLSQVTVENSSYAIYVTGYNNLNLDVTDTHIHDCHYGIYLDYSDAVPSIGTTVEDSTFLRNRVYGLVVDYKHFGRSSWYHGPHSFKTTVTNCVFDTGANGISYYSPEVMSGVESECLLHSNTFKNLHSGTIVQLYELSSFEIQNNRYSNNGGRALDIFYHAIGVKGTVKNNTFEHNHAVDNITDADIQNDTLILLAGNSDAEIFGTLIFTENIITNNVFPHILESSLVSMDMRFNIFENKMADCELCVTSLWVHGGKTMNASHNWWGTPKLYEATQRVSDFYQDMDVAASEISPILREPRVVGASWDTVPHRIVSGGNIADGGIVTGNVTAAAIKVVDVMATIYIPEGNRLNIPAGSHLRFAKDIGIVVEGQLHIQGSQEKPVILEQQPNAKWKGIRLAYANETTLSHVTMIQSRGIESTGCIPSLESAILRQSTGPGIWITVIQPPPIEIRGVIFENGAKEGVVLDIQGDGDTEVVLSIADCQVIGNKGTGIVIRAGNVIANISLEHSTIANNSQDGVSIQVSNGQLKMADNFFKSSHAGSSIQNNRLAHIAFDGRCMAGAVRDVVITGNSFSEENATSTPGSVLLEAPCINETSSWKVADNTFSIIGPTVPGEDAMLKFNMADNTKSRWPLEIQVVNNSFFCQTQVGSSVRLSVAHSERVSFHDNRIMSCDAPLLVETRYLPHELMITHNLFEKTGPIILQSVESVAKETYSSLNFSYNEVAGSTGEHEAVLKTSGYNASIHYNFFENPESRHDLWVGDMTPVNATLNWWGTPDFNRILSRVFDGRTDYSRAQADIFPCLLSRNYSNVSTANPDVFQITDNVIGGSVHGNITLPHSKLPYDVEYPIRVPPGSSLTIPGGVTLLFHNHTGIFADGRLILDGNSTAWIDMKPANDTTSWRGITVGKPRDEYMRVRLSGSRLPYTGRVEAYVSGVWRAVCADGFSMAAAHVVCKELSFFDAESITEMAAPQSSFGVSDVKCTGLEISLLDCNVRTGLLAKCQTGKTPVVVCQQENNVPVFTRRKRSTSVVSVPVVSRRKRSTSVVSDNYPTILKFTRITRADVGLQVNDDDGIQLESMNVMSSTGPGVVLSSRGSMGVHLTDCTVAEGGDVGIDVAGSCPITMSSTNVTSNKLAGVTVVVKGVESDIHIENSIISENGEDGIHAITDARFNISGCNVQQNKKMGIVLEAATAFLFHTIVDDHVPGGVKLHVSDGQLSVKNSVFANNGGNTMEATVTIASNSSTKPFVEFEKAGVINSSVHDTLNNSHPSYAVVLHLDSAGATNSSNATAVIPVSFVETQMLDSFGDGLLIEDLRGELNLTIAHCTFEHIEGTAVNVVTDNTAPELYFQGNIFHHVRNNTLVVDTGNR